MHRSLTVIHIVVLHTHTHTLALSAALHLSVLISLLEESELFYDREEMGKYRPGKLNSPIKIES